MKTMTLLLLAIVFTSCHKFNGKLTVKDHLYFYNNGQNDYLIEGNYDAKIKINKKRILIKANNSFQKTKIKINIPSSLEAPEYSLKKIHKLTQQACEKKSMCENDFSFKLEAFYLDSEETKQPFHTTGIILVHREKSKEITTKEPCQVQINLQECQLNETWRNNYSMCRNGLPGTRIVKYKSYKYDMDFDVVLRQDEIKKATFTSNKKATFKDYTYFGQCQLN